MNIVKEVRLNPAGAAYVIQMALRATNVPMADSFGPYVTNALNWVYSNGGHFGVAENSPLDQYMAQAVMQAQAQAQAQNGQRPVQVAPPQPRPAPVQQVPPAYTAPQPYVQHPPHTVPVNAPMAQLHPAQQAQQAAPGPGPGPGGNGTPQVPGEPESLTSAPINPSAQESLANSDAVLLG